MLCFLHIFCLLPSWSGVCKEATEVVSEPQPADQHQRDERCIYTAPPGLLSQPPGQRGGSGEQCSASHTGSKRKRPYWGKNSRQMTGSTKSNITVHCCNFARAAEKVVWVFETGDGLELSLKSFCFYLLRALLIEKQFPLFQKLRLVINYCQTFKK